MALGVAAEELWPDMYKVPIFKSCFHTHTVRPSGKPFCYSKANVKNIVPGTWDNVSCALCHDQICFPGGKENTWAWWQIILLAIVLWAVYDAMILEPQRHGYKAFWRKGNE